MLTYCERLKAQRERRGQFIFDIAICSIIWITVIILLNNKW